MRQQRPGMKGLPVSFLEPQVEGPAILTNTVLPLHRLDAFIFDMDGVVTKTAVVHAAAWKRLFDDFLAGEAAQTNGAFEVFDPVADYRRYVDGKNRYDGVESFLAARGIHLPHGDSSDLPGMRTVCGLGNMKDAYFNEHLEKYGAEAYPSTMKLVQRLKAAGRGVAIVTASRNADAVLASAGLADLFDQKVDGVVAAGLGLPGKPDPAMFLEASRRLGAEPSRAAVIEDALAGVQAGRAGGFGLVVGVDRLGQEEALKASGADFVVADLDEVELPG